MVKNNIYEPIFVYLIENKYKYDLKDSLPAHDLIIKPLLDNCIYCYVFGISDDSDLYLNNKNILIKDKGKHKIDTSKECIKGHEYLWNVTGGKRGSIIIVLENNLDLLNKLLKHTFIDIECDIPLMDNPNSWNTISAIKKCKEEMDNGNIAICLTRNNGLEVMFIYIEEKCKENIIKSIMEKCKKIDRKRQALEF